MSGLFGSDPPPPQEPPKPPTIDDAAQIAQTKDAMLRRRGRAASIYTSGKGAPTPETTAKSLLGG